MQFHQSSTNSIMMVLVYYHITGENARRLRARDEAPPYKPAIPSSFTVMSFSRQKKKDFSLRYDPIHCKRKRHVNFGLEGSNKEKHRSRNLKKNLLSIRHHSSPLIAMKSSSFTTQVHSKNYLTDPVNETKQK